MKGIFLDIETSGLDCYKHRSLEIALQVIDVTSRLQYASFCSYIKQSDIVWNACDPNSLKVNGLTRELIQTGISEKEARNQIESLLIDAKIRRGEAVFICQNPSFDRPFFSQIIPSARQEELMWPYHWLDLASMFWICQLQDPKASLPWETGISKNQIALSLGLRPEQVPHRAMQGVEHLIECYFKLLSRSYAKYQS